MKVVISTGTSLTCSRTWALLLAGFSYAEPSSISHCLGGFKEILVLRNELSKQSNALISVFSMVFSLISFLFFVSDASHLKDFFSISFSLNPFIS